MSSRYVGAPLFAAGLAVAGIGLWHLGWPGIALVTGCSLVFWGARLIQEDRPLGVSPKADAKPGPGRHLHLVDSLERRAE